MGVGGVARADVRFCVVGVVVGQGGGVSFGGLIVGDERAVVCACVLIVD